MVLPVLVMTATGTTITAAGDQEKPPTSASPALDVLDSNILIILISIFLGDSRVTAGMAGTAGRLGRR
jgi:hypothetical protein